MIQRRGIIVEDLSSDSFNKALIRDDLDTILSGKEVYSHSLKQKPTSSDRYSA